MVSTYVLNLSLSKLNLIAISSVRIFIDFEDNKRLQFGVSSFENASW